jgi:hypothetical protein
MFHRKCLKPALQSRSHCPNCRTPAGPKNVIKKLYFNQSKEDEDSEWDDSDFGSDEVETTEPDSRNYDATYETLDDQARSRVDDTINLTIGTVYNDFYASLLNSYRSRQHKHFVNLLRLDCRWANN